MKYSQATQKYAKTLILNYAEYDSNNQLKLDVADLHHFELCKLVSLLMIDNKDKCSEATGPDNLLFFNYMVPALINYMSDIDSPKYKEEFIKAWDDSISGYYYDEIADLINETLDYLNSFGDDDRWAA